MHDDDRPQDGKRGRPRRSSLHREAGGQLLREEMGFRALTVKDVTITLKARCGVVVSERTVAAWRDGERGPNEEQARQLDDALGTGDALRLAWFPEQPGAPGPVDETSVDEASAAEVDQPRGLPGDAGRAHRSAARGWSRGTAERTRRLSPLAVAGAAVVLLAAGWAVAATRPDDGQERASATPTVEASCTPPVQVSLDGAATVTEIQGSLGAPTFRDPGRLCGSGPKVPAMSSVQVVCRLYAPSIPSVMPDGYWYLVGDGPAAGHFAAANTFLNGDVPGEDTVTYTDEGVPVCG